MWRGEDFDKRDGWRWLLRQRRAQGDQSMAIDYSGIKRAANDMIGAARRLVEEIEAAEREHSDTAYNVALREPQALGAAGVHADSTAASPQLAARAGSPATERSMVSDGDGDKKPTSDGDKKPADKK